MPVSQIDATTAKNTKNIKRKTEDAYVCMDTYMGNKNSLPVLFQVEMRALYRGCTFFRDETRELYRGCDATCVHIWETHIHIRETRIAAILRDETRGLYRGCARVHMGNAYVYVKQEFCEMKREDCTERANVTSGNYSSPLVSFDPFSWYAREQLNIVGKQW